MTTSDDRRLVLWDIDLTLIDARGFGKDWYTRALAEISGEQLRTMPETAGRTELAIAGDVLEWHGVPVDESSIDRIFTALAAVVDADRTALSRGGSAMPGAEAILGVLAGMPDFVQTAVTGNLPSVAFAKLDSFGLHQHIDFEIGGFGTDSPHRHDLIAASVAKAREKHGTTFAPEDVVVVGDTPHDVAGALRSGAVAIGVATGGSDEDELREAGAHVVLRDLTDTEAVLAALRFRADTRDPGS